MNRIRIKGKNILLLPILPM